MVFDSFSTQVSTGDAHYQAIARLTHDIIFAADRDGCYSYLTANIKDRLGYAPDELTGKPITCLVHAHWRDRATEFYEAQLREYLEETRLELPVVTPQDDQVWVQFMVRLVMEDNQAVGYFGVIRDITAHKESIRQWDQHIQNLEILRRVNDELMHTLNMPYVLSVALDATVRLTAADAGAIHLLEDEGIRTVQVIGAFPADLLDTFIEPNVGIVGRVLRTGEGELVLDVTHDPDYIAHVPAIRAQLTVPLTSQSKPIGVLSVMAKKADRFTPDSFELVTMLAAQVTMVIENARLYDESQHQLMELQELYARVRALEQIKTDMIRIAAHDLRNPLTNILSAAYLLNTTLGESPADMQTQMLTTIDQSVARMKKITNDILSLERIEELAAHPLHETIQLQLLVTQAYIDFERQASEKGVLFTLEDGDRSIKVRGDTAQLNEVIANLVGNALKYTPVGGKVWIGLRAEDNRAILEVRDTGFGIPESQQERLFQPFFRAKTAETRAIEGTGLGLHLVKNIIERHGGQMRFHSVYGKGSTFGFELPLAEK